MAWGITIPEVSLSRMRINELESKKEELEYNTNLQAQRLIMLASHIPNQSNREWLRNLQDEVNDILIKYGENYHKITLIDIALDQKDELTEY